ncbi:DUF3152 domain-containing protein [Streptomyces sp. NPDC052309]|uniref:DUF3152 domain-containing protein n=1 Tax=Streptomyces sp. NPDC052309 TaxID=3155421 RepID=UPI003430AD11
MGRHSRRGPAPKGDTAETAAVRPGRPGGRRMSVPPTAEQMPPGGGGPGGPSGYPGHPGYPGGRLPDGAPGRGAAGPSEGTPGRGGPLLPDGTPARGVPRLPDGTPAHGVPRAADGTPARGMPQVRGGHPEQREPGGGWGELRGRATGVGFGPPPGAPGAPAQPGRPAGSGAPFPRQRQAPSYGPRQEYLDAFGEDDVFTPRSSRRPTVSAPAADPYASVTDWNAGDATGGTAYAVGTDAVDAPPPGAPAPAKGGKGRTFTGIAAAAVTTVLAVVVAGQVADGRAGGDTRSQSAGDPARDAHDSASRADDRPTPSPPGASAPLTYEQKMGKTYPLGAELKGSGRFDAVPGIDKAPGTGQKYTYRVDIEQGLGLDGELFAQAVQKTLNDDRSWAHNGARTFERIHSGQPDFVITLASPGTTAEWCAKSGLDTTVDNVSCDSAATERVMINAYRWAQGAEPYGDQIHAYRQMLINHEVGHRLGFNHVTCDKDGELAPVMQQQTKFVDHDGIDCRPNPWAYPGE